MNSRSNEADSNTAEEIGMAGASEDIPEVIYSHASCLRFPQAFFCSMWQGFLDGRELAWRLFVRDLAARYRQSIFGLLWVFLPPIVTGLFFIFLQSVKVLNLGETQIPYPLYVLAGTTLWQMFVDGLNAPRRSVAVGKSILAKVRFPWEALILAAFYDVIFNVMVKMLVLMGILMFFKVSLSPFMIFFPAVISSLILLGFAIGLVLTPLEMIYKDVSSLMSIAIPLWFFITPVIYPPPESPPFSLLAVFNPVSPLVITARDVITLGVVTNAVPFLAVCILAIAAFLVGWGMYRLAIPILIERMDA